MQLSISIPRKYDHYGWGKAWVAEFSTSPREFFCRQSLDCTPENTDVYTVKCIKGKPNPPQLTALSNNPCP